jgi:hypothetical protein
MSQFDDNPVWHERGEVAKMQRANAPKESNAVKVKRRIATAVAAEREACAKIAEEVLGDRMGHENVIAAKIRARGKA